MCTGMHYYSGLGFYIIMMSRFIRTFYDNNRRIVDAIKYIGRMTHYCTPTYIYHDIIGEIENRLFFSG